MKIKLQANDIEKKEITEDEAKNNSLEINNKSALIK